MYKVAQESNSLRAPRISVGIKDKATNYLSWLMFTLKKLIPHVFTSSILRRPRLFVSFGGAWPQEIALW